MKKRILAIVTAICMIIAMTPLNFGPVYAETIATGSCGEDMSFEISDDGVLTIIGSGEMCECNPAPWDEYSETIGGIVLNEGIASISDYAFSGLYNLSGDIHIPDSVTYIGKGAFDECSGLTGELVLPSSLKEIGTAAFRGCSGFSGTLYFPAFFETFSYAACFAGCTGITKAVFNNDVQSIGDFAIGSTYDPNGVGYGYLDNFTIQCPCNAYNLIDYADAHGFDVEITHKGMVSRAGGSISCLPTIYYCSKCDRYYYDEDGREELEKIEGSGHILRHVPAKEATTEPGNIEYWECKNCGKKFLDDLGYEEVSEEDIVIDVPADISWSLDAKGKLTLTGSGSMDNLNMDDSVRNQVKKIVIEEGITSIKEDAFAYYPYLESVEIPSSVKKIGRYAFYSCDKLKSINIPDTVDSIGDYAVGYYYSYDTNSEAKVDGYMILGKEGSEAEKYADRNGISFGLGHSLVYHEAKNFTYDPNSGGKINGNFEYWYCSDCGKYFADEKAMIEVPYDSLVKTDAGRATWTLDDEGILTVSGNGSMENFQIDYYERELVKSIVIEEGITSIKNAAFGYFVELESVEIPSTVKAIGSFAFSSCKKLKSVVVPDTVEYIGECAIGCGFDSAIGKVGPLPGYCIMGKPGSAAENYAKSYGVEFRASYNLIKHEAKKATCTEDGNIEYWYCPELNKYYRDNTQSEEIAEGSWIIPKGHKLIKHDKVQPSYEKKGSKEYWECEACHKLFADENATNEIDKEDIILTVIDSGKCGDDLIWTFDIYGILKISGTGAMYDYDDGYQPWPFAREGGEYQLVLEPGITYIGKNAFKGYSNIGWDIKIPDTVETIGESAFEGNSRVQTIKFSTSLKTICDRAFYDCRWLGDMIMLPDSIEHIETDAFKNCNASEGLIIPAGISDIKSLPHASFVYVYRGSYGETFAKNNLAAYAVEIEYMDDIDLFRTFFEPEDEIVNLVIGDTYEMGEHVVTSIGHSVHDLSITIDNDVLGIRDGEDSVKLVAKKEGTAVVHVALKEYSYDFTVNVVKNEIPIEDLTFDNVDNSQPVLLKSAPVLMAASRTNALTAPVLAASPIEKMVVATEATVSARVKYIPEKTTQQKLIWKSSNTSVATVDKGMVTGVKEGTAIITAYSAVNNEINESIEVTVKKNVPKIATFSDKVEYDMHPGSAEKIQYYVSSNEYGDEIKFTSCDNSVVRVGADGTMRAVGVGTTRVKISLAGQYQYVTVNVKHRPGIISEGPVSPTCTKEGYTMYSCRYCNEVYKDDIRPALGHNWNTGNVTAKATFTKDGEKSATCSRCGKHGNSVTVPKAEKIVLSTEHYTYSGTVKEPTVKVYDSKGKIISSDYYTVTYASGRKAVGKYKVTVNFKSDCKSYAGSSSAYFYIDSKAPTVSAMTYTGSSSTGYKRVKLSWGKVTGATGYIVQYKKSSAESWSTLNSYTTSLSCITASGKLATGTKYNFRVQAVKKTSSGTITNRSAYSAIKSVTTLKKLDTPKVGKYSSSKAKVTWTKISGASGYQVSRSTSKTGTSIKATVSSSYGSKTISATKGKTYYYKVRAYKKVGTKKIYAPWSVAVSYKIR